jgi:hypothetical protein
MKKTQKKLSLSRETLSSPLEESGLRKVDGGDSGNACTAACATNYSGCRPCATW